MLAYLRTSILKSQAQTVVNTVNTVGVMGKGLAAEFRSRYPEMFLRYREICESQLLDIGKLWLWKGESQWVLNFPTKRHWRQPSRLSYIEAGLIKFADSFEERGITDIAFPRLGCGNGGLKWEEVQPLMERYLRPLPIQVYVHDYEVDLGRPEHAEAISSCRVNSFNEFWRDLSYLAQHRSKPYTTISSRSPFKVKNGSAEFIIRRGETGKEVSISVEEMEDVWALLNRGILTRKKLTGKLHDEASYLIAFLSELPYVRAVEVEKSGAAPSVGLELTRRTGVSSEVAQQGFELR